MRLPEYQARGSLDIGGGPRMIPTDTSMARAFVNLGQTVVGIAEDIASSEQKQAAKLKATRERNENLSLEYDLLQTQNRWQEVLQSSQENAREDAADFTDNYAREIQGDVDALTQKYADHHDPEYVKLKIAQARNPYVDAASKFEFKAGLEFKKKVIDDKVANLSSAFAAGTGISLEQVEAEYRDFVDKSISGNENVRKQGYEYGLRTIQKAYVESLAARDKATFIEHYKKTISADANSQVLPPHISTVVANAQAQGADPQLMLAIGWIESRLNPNAGRPTRKDGTEMSSAEGMFQVLAGDNPTAEATRNALGITRADVKDVDKVSTALSAFLVRKQEWMRANGIQPTPGRTYMMWNLGEGAAAAVMRANPNERIENVLARVWASQGPKFLNDAIYNNPSMYRPGMTVGQVIANYEAKVSGATNAVGKITAGAGITVEDRAKLFVNQFAGIKDNQYVTAADLADIAEKVVADYGKEQKANLDLERGRARLNGELPTDPYNTDHRKDIEKALELNFPPLVEGIAAGDGGALSTVRAIAADVRHVPAPLRNAMRTTMETGDAGAKARVYGSLLDLRKADRTAFNASGFDRDTEKMIEEFEAYTTEMLLPPEVAISRIEKSRSEEGKIRSRVMSEDVNRELGKISDKRVLGGMEFDTVGSEGIDANRLTPIIRSHFETVYRNAREDGKDKTEAEALASASVKSAFSVSYSASGGSEAVVTLYPPETQYPALSNSHEWITEQARNQVAVHLLVTGRVKGYVGPTDVASGGVDTSIPAWKVAEEKTKSAEVRLISTAQTLDDVRHGRPASYQLWYRNERGQVEKVSDSFVPDVEQAVAVDRARFKAGHKPPTKQQRDVRRWLNDVNLAN